MRYKVYLAILFCLFICDSSRGQGIPQWGNWNAWGEYQDSLYRNPIIPADFSDIDCIRVGEDYYAISSTFQFSPGMTVLHSKDFIDGSYDTGFCEKFIKELKDNGSIV